MTQRQSFGVLIAHGLIACLLIAAAAVLCALGKLDAAAVTGIFGAVLGFAGGAGITQGQAIINGGPKPDLTKLAAYDPTIVAAILGKYPMSTTPAATHAADQLAARAMDQTAVGAPPIASEGSVK